MPTSSSSSTNGKKTTPPKKRRFRRGRGATARTPEERAAAEAARQNRLYFNANTQAAIVAYQQSPDRRERDRLYVETIMPAFQKLVENLINIHRFSGLHDTYEELRNDCVAFLFETIRKFDGTRGTNAFSYFNVVAKNWLIIRTKQRVQRMRRSVSLDDPTALSTAEQKHIDDVTMASPQPKVMSGDVGALVELLREIKTRAKNENELSCINSIITVFDQVDEIDLLSKGAVLMYIRELSGLTPKQLTTTMQAVKRHYRKLRTDPRFDGALG